MAPLRYVSECRSLVPPSLTSRALAVPQSHVVALPLLRWVSSGCLG